MKGINKKMDSNKQMADLLFKNITKTPDDYEQMYPKRNLEEGAVNSFCTKSDRIFAFRRIVCRIYRKDGDKVNKRCILSENRRYR